MKLLHLGIILLAILKGNEQRHVNGTTWHQRRRIVGGKLASIDNYPSAACLILKTSEGDDFRGGAVIISRHWALTAAHCLTFVDPGDIEKGVVFVRGNTANWKKDFIDHAIVENRIHENYDFASTDYDIALVKVKEPFDGPHEKPIKIAPENYEYVEDSHTAVIGWGTTDSNAPNPFIVDNLRFVYIKIVAFESCKDAYKGAGEGITERMVCAISPGKDACVYDSGGPLYQNNLLVGLVSWGGTACADLLFPGVYTRVSVFRDWIRENTLGHNDIGMTPQSYNPFVPSV